MKYMTRLLTDKVGIMLLALWMTNLCHGATFIALTSGNFSSNATWVGNIVPPTTISTDAIVIPLGLTVNLDQNIVLNGALAQLTVAGALTSSTNSSVTVNEGTLIGAGTITIGDFELNTGATFSFTGSLAANVISIANTISSNADLTAYDTLNLTTGALSLVSGGSFTIGNDAIIVIQGGSLTVGAGGSIDLSTEYNVTYLGNSIMAGLELTGSGLQDVLVNLNPAGTLTLAADLTVGGMLSIMNGNLILAGQDLVLNGNVSATGNGMISSTSTSNIILDGAQDMVGAMVFAEGSTVNNLVVDVGTGHQAKIGGSIGINGALQLVSGILNFDSTNLTLNGSFTGTGELSANSASNLIITVAGGLNKSLSFDAAGQVIHDLILNLGIGQSVALGSDLTIGGMLALTGGSQLDLNSNTLILDVSSSLEGTGSFLVDSNSNLNIFSADGIAFLSMIGTMGDLIINTDSNRAVILGSNAMIGGTLFLQSGFLVLNDFDLSILGNVVTSAESSISSTAASDISVIVTSGPVGTLYFTAGANTVGNLIIQVGANGIVNVGTDLQIAGMLQFDSGKLDIDTHQLVLGPAATVVGAGANAYVITEAGGQVQMHVEAGGKTGVSFPVGTSTYFAPAEAILDPGSSSGTININVVNNVYAEGTTGDDWSNTKSVVDATWNVTSDIVTNLNLTLKVMWTEGMEVNGFDHEGVYVSHYINSDWDFNYQAAASMESNGMFSLERTGITSLSPFAVFDKNTITAIGRIDEESQISLFPNPATDQVNVESKSVGFKPVQMDIFSTAGEWMGGYNLNEETNTIFIHQLGSGNYFVRLNTPQGVVIKLLSKI